MLGYKAVGRILNGKTKGLVGYKVTDGKGGTFNYRLKDIHTLVAQSKFTNLELDVNGYIKLIGNPVLDNYYVTEEGIVTEEEFNSSKIEEEKKQEEVKQVQRSRVDIMRVTCDNFEYEITMRVFDLEKEEDIKDVIERKVKKVKDRFNGECLEFSCDELQLEEIVDLLGIKLHMDELAVKMYLEDDEYLGNYIESERRVEWFSRDKVSYEVNLRIVERLQGICNLVGNE